MSKNIICEESHKKCIVPQRVSTKLRMLATAAAIGLTLTTFSGCTSAVQDLGQYVETIEEESKVANLEENKETNEESQQEQEETKEEVSLESEYLSEGEKQQEEYKQLRLKMNSELQKKLFSNEVNKLFIDTLERLYVNYNTWQEGYKDLPSREEYIEKNLINVIKTIDEVDFYEKESKEGQTLLRQMGAPAWTELTEDNSLRIGIIANPSNESEPNERDDTIELFYHEIKHCDQKELLIQYHSIDREELMDKFQIEGGATFHMKFIKPLTTKVGGTWSIANEKGDVIIDYSKENCSGYLVELNAYEKLVYLVGYDTMEQIQKRDLEFADLEEKIAQKYGEEIAGKIWGTLCEWYEAYCRNWSGKEVYDLSIQLEKQFLDCMKKDINESTTKEELEYNIRIYKHYKEKNLPQVMMEGCNDITHDVFEIDSFDVIIENKMQSLGEER